MLVKVSKKYCGTLGLFNPDTNSITQKDNTSAPFEMDDALALSHMKNGILVKADDKEEEPMINEEPFTEMPTDVEKTQEESENMEELLESVPDGIPDELPEELPSEEDDLEKITDYKVLVKMAKKAGINPFGKNKEELREAIREANA